MDRSGACGPQSAGVSSHREAPLISEDPAAGPNYGTFGQTARFDICVDRNGDGPVCASAGPIAGQSDCCCGRTVWKAPAAEETGDREQRRQDPARPRRLGTNVATLLRA